jgi:GTP:adenosylcobinamide-phosphate guanylyltransferase
LLLLLLWTVEFDLLVVESATLARTAPRSSCTTLSVIVASSACTSSEEIGLVILMSPILKRVKGSAQANNYAHARSSWWANVNTVQYSLS